MQIKLIFKRLLVRLYSLLSHFLLWFSFGLGMAMSFVTIYTIMKICQSLPPLTDENLTTGLTRLMPLQGLIAITDLSCLVFFAVALEAAIVTRLELAKNPDLTLYTSRWLTWGFILYPLYRLRMSLAFLAGLAPLSVFIGMMPFGAECAGACRYTWALGGPTQNGIAATMLVIDFWLFYIVAAALGVWLSLWWRRIFAVIFATLIALVMITGGIYNQYLQLALMGYGWGEGGNHDISSLPELWHLVSTFSGLLILLPLILIFVLSRIAELWVQDLQKQHSSI